MASFLKFLGGSQTVTGSKISLSLEDKIFLIDCGLFQGGPELRAQNWDPFPIPVQKFQAVILTHAHLDHSGYLPRLVKQGYNGPVFCTQGTRDLCEILLLDSAHLQEEDAIYANKTGHSRHKPALPLYSAEDVEDTLKLFRPLQRNTWIAISESVSIRFRRSGHIVGSSFVELRYQNLHSGESKILVFSGDIGHNHSKILIGPDEAPPEADLLVLESTYGGKTRSRADPLVEMESVARRTLERGGVLLIPAFAVGRSQEVLHIIRLLEDAGKIPRVPVLLDSPLASKATSVFKNHPEDHVFGTAFLDFDLNFWPSRFEIIESTDDSFMACMRGGPLIVVSAAGMLSGGRILHHLKRRVSEEKNTVLFVGYQAEGSKGRYLQELKSGQGEIRIHHTQIPVNCEIVTLDSLSAHGDPQDLSDWLRKVSTTHTHILLNHGTPEAAKALKDHLGKAFNPKKIEISEPGVHYPIF